jgi:hypothetical protein
VTLSLLSRELRAGQRGSTLGTERRANSRSVVRRARPRPVQSSSM